MVAIVVIVGMCGVVVFLQLAEGQPDDRHSLLNDTWFPASLMDEQHPHATEACHNLHSQV